MISIMKSMSGFRKQAKYFATDTTVIRRYWMVGPDIVSQEDFVGGGPVCPSSEFLEPMAA
jgi:hypothetical protein